MEKLLTVSSIRNIVYGQGIDRRLSKHAKINRINLHGDIYSSATDKQPRPCVMLLHGGSWERGSAGQQGYWANPIAREGYVVFCPTYRRSYQDTFPGALEDVKCAVRFLRAHADEYGVDTNHIAMMGGSAGGHLSMMTALTPGKWEGLGGYHDQSSAIQAVVSIAGPTFLPNLAKDGFVQRLLGGPIWATGMNRYLEASPLCHIHNAMPPLLMLHSKHDPSVNYRQSMYMWNLCQRFPGANVELITVKGSQHNILMFGKNKVELLQKVVGWLSELFFAEG